jgi:hypothetical protein
MAAFDEFKKDGVDHAVRAAELMDVYLPRFGAPLQKTKAVKEAILSHMYYADVLNNQEAKYLHDADTLDFFGTIGVVRIISITHRHRWAKDFKSGLETLKQFQKDLPAKLLGASAKKLAEKRSLEMSPLLETIKKVY